MDELSVDVHVKRKVVVDQVVQGRDPELLVPHSWHSLVNQEGNAHLAGRARYKGCHQGRTLLLHVESF